MEEPGLGVIQLDMMHDELIRPDGYIIPLTMEETAHFGTAFLVGIQADAEINAIASVPSCEDTNTCGGEMKEPAGLTTPWKLVKSERTPTTKNSRVGIEVTKVRWTKGGKVREKRLNGQDGITMLDWPMNCASMRAELALGTEVFRTKRTGLLGWIVGIIASLFEVDGNNKWRLNPVSWFGIAVTGEIQAAEMSVSGTQIGIARSLYQGFGCGAINFPTNAAGGGPYGGGRYNAGECSTSMYERFMNGQGLQLWISSCLLVPVTQ